VALERLWHLLKTHVPTYKGTAATTWGIWGVPQQPASKKFQTDVWTMEWRLRPPWGRTSQVVVKPVAPPAYDWIPLFRVCIGPLLGWTRPHGMPILFSDFLFESQKRGYVYPGHPRVTHVPRGGTADPAISVLPSITVLN
jgi:hypothetical protein